MIINKILSILACIAALPLMSCASQSQKVQGHMVCINPSKAFQKVVGGFSVSKEQALELALQHRQAQRPDLKKHAIGTLVAVVDRYYVFSLPQKDGTPLSGIYVNGDNGSVEDRVFLFKIVNGRVVKADG